MDQSKRAAIRKELIKHFLKELGVKADPEEDADEEMEDLSASPVQREADSTEARQVSEYMKKIKSFFIEHRTRSEFQSLKRSRMSSSSDEDADDDDDEEYFKQQAERRKKHKAYPTGQGQPRRYMTARSTMPVVVTKVDDRPLPSRSNH